MPIPTPAIATVATAMLTPTMIPVLLPPWSICISPSISKEEEDWLEEVSVELLGVESLEVDGTGSSEVGGVGGVGGT